MTHVQGAAPSSSASPIGASILSHRAAKARRRFPAGNVAADLSAVGWASRLLFVSRRTFEARSKWGWVAGRSLLRCWCWRGALRREWRATEARDRPAAEVAAAGAAGGTPAHRPARG